MDLTRQLAETLANSDGDGQALGDQPADAQPPGERQPEHYTTDLVPVVPCPEVRAGEVVPSSPDASRTSP